MSRVCHNIRAPEAGLKTCSYGRAAPSSPSLRQSKLDDRTAGDLALAQIQAGLVDFIELIALCNQLVEGQLPLLEPAHQQGKVAVRDAAAAGRPPVGFAAED